MSSLGFTVTALIVAIQAEVIFVSIFLVVLCCIAAVLALAAWRTHRALTRGKVEDLRWHAEFEDLPERLRRCRHAFTGERPGRTCEHGFDCRECDGHAALCGEGAPARRMAGAPALPVALAEDRLYHRGHTWVKPRPDGTLDVGLDPLGERLLGTPDQVELPPVGARVDLNGAAFRVRRGSATARVLAPVSGTVVAQGGPAEGFFLRVQPDEPQPDLSHLLEAREARAWLQCELEALHPLLNPARLGVTLADGGDLVQDLPAAVPTANWDALWSEFFLEP